MKSKELTHLDVQGRAQMVDVGAKDETEREAIACGEIKMLPETLAVIQAGNLKKGDVFTVAQVAGILAAKKTAELIPMCHPLVLDQIEVRLKPDPALPGIEITARVSSHGRTGVEMEALTAVSVAALTVYDMAKAVEKTMQIQNIRLVSKRGGVSGEIHNE